jgi:putative ABC transport system permease protein
MNLRLAAYLAWRSLSHHRTVAIATLLGVALGMTVVGAILIVDFHSIQSGIQPEKAQVQTGAGAATASEPLHIFSVSFEHQHAKPAPVPAFPSQKGQAKQGWSTASPPARRGEEDYQAMRLAVRLASLLAFAVGAVIVFYTMRFSVASRSREFCLLLCLGEERRNVVGSLLLETLGLGVVGTLLGLLGAFPAALSLIAQGISTTGRVPTSGLAVPWAELSIMAGLSVCIALLAVAGPARAVLKMNIVDVLQPRFLSADIDERSLQVRGFGLLIPPLMAAAYLALRPFLLSWLSVVQFFLFESVFVLLLGLAVLWWMNPLLRGLVSLLERLLKPLLPLEALLAGRRMKLTGQKLVFTLAGVALVFSLLTALHDITRSLKEEIRGWSNDALIPYIFFEKNTAMPLDEEAFKQLQEKHSLHFFRLSDKMRGEFPIRLAKSSDINPYLESIGMKPLVPGTVIVSKTMAARFGLQAGDAVVIDSDAGQDRFKVIEITDKVGYYGENGQYVDLKSYLLFSDGNPVFASNLERGLGMFGAARHIGKGIIEVPTLKALEPFYRKTQAGYYVWRWQEKEIDRDFVIFDFILAMTVILAVVGVANTILIQVHGRSREFSVLRTLGVSRLQTMRLLLVEGALVGLVGALLALALGNAMGAVSISFLDRFTLFDYQFIFSGRDSLIISALAIGACSVAAVYPALIANRISSAESLHYE